MLTMSKNVLLKKILLTIFEHKSGNFQKNNVQTCFYLTKNDTLSMAYGRRDELRSFAEHGCALEEILSTSSGKYVNLSKNNL